MSEANGGAERDRTADPLLAKQVLSQLSYSPNQLDHQEPQAVPSSATQRTNQIPRQPSKWWAREDLNFRPHAYQACALTN